MTAGNLSVHLRKLEDAGYVEVTKTHQGRTPATLVASPGAAGSRSRTTPPRCAPCWRDHQPQEES